MNEIAGISPLDLSGWIAALLTLAAMAMRTMLPLRVFATLASLVFLGAALYASLFVFAALAAAILGANLYRLLQLFRASRAAQKARDGQFSIDWIQEVTRPVKFSDGEVIFRKGDAPHYIYYIKSGQVRLEEIDVTLEAGELFGEIAFFTDDHERTLTAICEGSCEIMAIRETDLVALHHQNPAFGLFLLQLVATRLLDGVENHPEAYRRISALARKRQET